MNTPLCPTCNGSLNFVPEYSRWYCYHCAAYIEPPTQAVQQPTQTHGQEQYRKQLGATQQRQSMVYVKGQQPYEQQQVQAGQGKVCKQCGTVNENWSVTCKSCRSGIC